MKEIVSSIVEKVSPEIKTEIEATFEAAKKGLMMAEDFQTQMEQYAKGSDIEGLNEKLDNLGVELKKMQESRTEKKNESIGDVLRKNHEAIRNSLSEKKAFTLDMNLKTNVTSASITSDGQGVFIPGFGQEAYRGMVFENYFQRFTLPANHHGTVYYVDQTTVTRNADNKDEAAAAPESALAWTQRSIGMGKILDSIPLTHESMTNIAELENEVRNFLMTNVMLEVDSNMWNGDGTLPNWKGIYTYATDFTQALAAAGIAAGTVPSVQDASLYDLIVAISTYITNNKQSKYMPNVVFMNPSDVNKMRLKKDANDNYLIPPFASQDLMNVAGIKVVESSAVTANTLAMGDSRMVRYYDVEGISLEFGLDSDDFTKDLITLKARKRGNVLLRTIDATSWYKVTDIDQRITDITV